MTISYEEKFKQLQNLLLADYATFYVWETLQNEKYNMYKIKVAEAAPRERIVWEVVDSKQDWVKNSSEWTGTEIIWDISLEKKGARITMTHKGLDPELECYKTCVGGWDYLISESLLKLLQENMGEPA
ncbi:MAG: hypothetical protein B7X04_03285 [Parcubacteria group bacterium 21-54-25]|nr:MAG: hypothetical protein B7X04_03285 [Parcubacteria group bacterium 21-54-25]HQU08046.1 SRPBCC domain-containing protein [Candidatus Paceibacterota bacterium]